MQPGEERLQKQVRGLFARLDIIPEQVLAGNLVPFRSKDWNSLGGKKDAIEFGLGLWKRLIQKRPRRQIIVMGSDTYGAFKTAFSASHEETRPAGWGAVRIFKARIGETRLIGLPHLSRFPIVGREQSEAAIQWALAKIA